MILIGENIHIISKSVREALECKNEDFVKGLIDIQSDMDYADLNVGPARGKLQGILPWLCKLVEGNSKLKISLDTTNSDEMRSGLKVCKNTENAFLNSTGKDEPRLGNITDMAAEYRCNLIALTMGKETGIPKTADGRLEIAFEIYEKCMEKGIDNSKIYFDPLILPVNVEQSQAMEAINTIKMIKESFDPPVNTVIGLSNISNGSPKELRPLINRVFAVLAFGAGLDAAIIDAKDTELIRVLKMLSENNPQNSVDELYIKLSEMIRDFSETDSIDYDKNSEEQSLIIKTADILTGKKIYSHSFTQI